MWLYKVWCCGSLVCDSERTDIPPRVPPPSTSSAPTAATSAAAARRFRLRLRVWTRVQPHFYLTSDLTTVGLFAQGPFESWPMFLSAMRSSHISRPRRSIRNYRDRHSTPIQSTQWQCSVRSTIMDNQESLVSSSAHTSSDEVADRSLGL